MMPSQRVSLPRSCVCVNYLPDPNKCGVIYDSFLFRGILKFKATTLFSCHRTPNFVPVSPMSHRSCGSKRDLVGPLQGLATLSPTGDTSALSVRPLVISPRLPTVL